MKRNGNNEGSLYYVVEKHKRKKFREEGECEICKNCTDRTACNGRVGWDKCQKCKDCKEVCLKYCDRFDCYGKYNAQITINGKHTTVGSGKKRKDAATKKLEAESKVHTKNYVRKNGVSLISLIKDIDNKKLESGIIKSNTQGSNLYLYKRLETANFVHIPIQKITSKMIQEFLNSLTPFLVQTEIQKYYDKIKIGFRKAIKEKLIDAQNDPLDNVVIPLSEKEKRLVEAFSIDEEVQLIKYICNNNLIKSNKCTYGNKTIRNLFLISLFSLTRIGELGSINYDTNIDFINKHIIIDNTLSRDETGKVIIGKNTKTGNSNKRKGSSDSRTIPFSTFDSEIMEHLLKLQIENSKNIVNNKEHLLFCGKDGSYIKASYITSIFKRTCRECHIKPNLISGCHIHMTRHTGITRLIEFGVDLLIIASISGHTDIREITRTYGHILSNFRKWQLDHPGEYYKKSDLITDEIKKIILNLN